MLLREEAVPCVPLPARLERSARFDVGDVKAAPEQFDLSLGLVVPVTTSPGPGLAGSRHPGNNHDAAPLALNRVLDPIILVIGGPHLFDRQARLIHLEVVAVESMPGGLRSLPARRRNPCGFPRSAQACRQTQHAQTPGQICSRILLTLQFSFHWIVARYKRPLGIVLALALADGEINAAPEAWLAPKQANYGSKLRKGCLYQGASSNNIGRPHLFLRAAAAISFPALVLFPGLPFHRLFHRA